jgi:hypothetical protein
LLSQTTKNSFHQAQQVTQQNGEELQCSASLLSTVATNQTQILIKKWWNQSSFFFSLLLLLVAIQHRLLQPSRETISALPSRETHFGNPVVMSG